MPMLMNTVMQEMICSANMAFGMYPGLSQGAYEALHIFGTEEQKQTYLHCQRCNKKKAVGSGSGDEKGVKVRS